MIGVCSTKACYLYRRPLDHIFRHGGALSTIQPWHIEPVATLKPSNEGLFVCLPLYEIAPITCNPLPSQGVTLPPRERLFLFRHSSDLRPVVKNTFLVASPACFVCRIVVFARVKNSIGKIRHLGIILIRIWTMNSLPFLVN